MQKLWEYKKLGDVCTVERGGSPRPIEKFITNDENGINWIKIGDTSDSMYITSTAQRIMKEGMKKSRYVKPGDFLLSNSMSFGRPYILKIDGCIHDGWLVLRDEEKVFDKRFLYYYLSSKSTYKKFEAMAVGGVVNNLNSEMVRNTYVPIPNKDVQLKIVNQFDMVRSILESRKKELLLLENLVRARFVEMFGNPVRNSKNWNTEKLCSIAPINKYNGDIDTVNGKVWLLNLDMIESCTGNIVDFLYEFENRITSSTIKFDENCVLYSKLRPYLNKVVIPERKGYATSELVSMSTEKINKYFLANLLRQDSFVNFSNATAYGAKMPRASMDLIKNFDVINPPTELQNKFGKLVIEVEKSKVEVQRAIDEAQLLFDSLMQKYFG